MTNFGLANLRGLVDRRRSRKETPAQEILEKSMTSEIEDKLQQMTEHAEFHAYSVRQMTAQRARLFKIFDIISSFPEAAHCESLPVILRAIEGCKSQFMQDIFSLLLNGGKKDGFFVEFGACDGLLISNTLLLEAEFGWKGILSEPAVSWHQRLKDNRKCTIDTRCVWSESGKEVTFAEFDNDEYHTQSAIIDANGEAVVANSYQVKTVSLYDLLKENGAPSRVDFISIDVEGGEYDILKAFPFNEYTFEFMCVEHMTREQENNIKILLESVGYRQILRSVSGHDGFYVPVGSPALAYLGEITPLGSILITELPFG